MSDLVMFACPEHGPVLETVPSALVWHNVRRCGLQCVPDISPEERKLARKRAATARRVARHRERTS